MYGCRVIQKAIDLSTEEEKENLKKKNENLAFCSIFITFVEQIINEWIQLKFYTFRKR